MLAEQLKGSTLDNLWDTHPPFQIDGNFGATSGIAEMLLQSRHDAIHVLPALPGAWRTGSVSGLRARGDVTVDATWKDGAPDTVTVRPGRSGPLRLRSSLIAGRHRILDDRGLQVGARRDGDTLTWDAAAGRAYTIHRETAAAVNATAAPGVPAEA